MIQFSNTIDPKSTLGVKTRKWIIGEAGYVGAHERAQDAYAEWLHRNGSQLDEDDELAIARVRGLVLLIMARRWEDFDPLYADGQATRFAKEFGGPVEREVMTSFFAEGARAIEMAPLMWLAFEKGRDRDGLVAKSLPALFTRPSKKVTSALRLLRRRYCDEKDGSGMSQTRAVLDQYARSHPDAPAAVSNAVVDFNLQRCSKPIRDSDD